MAGLPDSVTNGQTLRKVGELFLISVMSGSLVAAVTLFAGFINHRCQLSLTPIRLHTVSLLGRCRGQVEIFVSENGVLPQSLDQIPNADFWTSDGWGRPFLFVPHDDGTFELSSLGRDGQPGGVGPDADLGSGMPLNACVSFSQFVTRDNKEVASRGFHVLSATGGVLAALACFHRLWKSKTISPLTDRSKLFTVAVTTILAIAIGCLLLPFEVPSGH